MKKLILLPLITPLLAGCFPAQIPGADAKKFVHEYLILVYTNQPQAAGYECKTNGDEIVRRFPRGYWLASWGKGEIDPSLSFSARKYYGGLTGGGIRTTTVVTKTLTLTNGGHQYTREFNFAVIRTEEYSPLFDPEASPKQEFCILTAVPTPTNNGG